jgi:hypothetical protein
VEPKVKVSPRDVAAWCPGKATMTTRDDALAPPDRRLFWRWVGESARPYVGWVLVALGAIAIFFGWYGVSGQSLTAKQLPYLVSGGLSGIALVVIGAVFLAADHLRRQVGRLDGIERKVDDLYALLVLEPTPVAVGADEVATDLGTAGFVALPTGSTYHRPTCALVAGKPDVRTVDAAAIASDHLEPCPVCDPGPASPRG